MSVASFPKDFAVRDFGAHGDGVVKEIAGRSVKRRGVFRVFLSEQTAFLIVCLVCGVAVDRGNLKRFRRIG